MPTPADDEAATPPLSAMSGGAEAEGEKGAAPIHGAGDDAASEPESAVRAPRALNGGPRMRGARRARRRHDGQHLSEHARGAAATAPEPEESFSRAPEPEEERKFTFEDFVGSEWKVGLLWRGKDEADATWARCEADESVTWGFGARGKWRPIDEVRDARAREDGAPHASRGARRRVYSQRERPRARARAAPRRAAPAGPILTLTREFPLGWGGKRLFSARIDPAKPVYLEGIVRGWKPWEPATVMGLWQGDPPLRRGRSHRVRQTRGRTTRTSSRRT